MDSNRLTQLLATLVVGELTSAHRTTTVIWTVTQLLATLVVGELTSAHRTTTVIWTVTQVLATLVVGELTSAHRTTTVIWAVTTAGNPGCWRICIWTQNHHSDRNSNTKWS